MIKLSEIDLGSAFYQFLS